LCEIFKFVSFMPSKSVNNVCKLLQLLDGALEDFVPKPPTGSSIVDPTNGLPSPKLPGL